MAQKHVDPVDPDSDPDPEHCSPGSPPARPASGGRGAGPSAAARGTERPDIRPFLNLKGKYTKIAKNYQKSLISSSKLFHPTLLTAKTGNISIYAFLTPSSLC
jgi:hypothetical protein